ITGAALASAIVAFPLMLRTARSAFEAVPRELELTSYTLGVSPLRTWWRVTLPLARRGIFAGAILAFARASGEFGATLMVAGNIKGRTQTLPLAIYEAFIIGDDRTATIMVLLLTLLSLVVIFATLRLGKPAS
ncbi:ABC transporter permease subunit, partial [bacterium]|nr:ABC transporter permease subunit [bacterium]